MYLHFTLQHPLASFFLDMKWEDKPHTPFLLYIIYSEFPSSVFLSSCTFPLFLSAVSVKQGTETFCLQVILELPGYTFPGGLIPKNGKHIQDSIHFGNPVLDAVPETPVHTLRRAENRMEALILEDK